MAKRGCKVGAEDGRSTVGSNMRQAVPEGSPRGTEAPRHCRSLTAQTMLSHSVCVVWSEESWNSTVKGAQEMARL